MTTTLDSVAEIRQRYAEDGFTLPTSWEGIMEATVAGAIDADDLAELLGECARIVDAQLDKQGVRRLFSWREIASRYYTEIMEHREPVKELSDNILHMGKCADAVLRGETHDAN